VFTSIWCSFAVVALDFDDDVSVLRWRGRLGSSRVAEYFFRQFFDEVLCVHTVFRGMCPTELLDWQLNAVGRNRYLILQLAQEWVNKPRSPDWRYSTKRVALSHIRSFFAHNQASLPEDRGFRIRAEEPPVEGKLDFEGFRRIVHNSNKMYRAVWLMMAETLMGSNELIYVNMHYSQDVLQALSKNEGFVRLVFPGRKQNRNVRSYYSVFSTRGDAADVLRDYVKSHHRDARDCLFRNEFGKPLTRANIEHYFHRRAVEAGIVQQFTPECSSCGGLTIRIRKKLNGLPKIAYKCQECGQEVLASQFKNRFSNVRYGVNPHEIRDLVRSRWHVSGADMLVAEFFMGHLERIDPNHYDKFWKLEPNYPIKEYRQALPWLSISKDPDKIDKTHVLEELQARDKEISRMTLEMAEIKKHLGELNPEDLKTLNVFGEILKEPGAKERFVKFLRELPKELA
jgi:predicted RNA-binding Zn-ribbon protein involved in translation (DUF1610 family)